MLMSVQQICKSDSISRKIEELCWFSQLWVGFEDQVGMISLEIMRPVTFILANKFDL